MKIPFLCLAMIVLVDAGKGKSRSDLHFNHIRHGARTVRGHDGRLLQVSPPYGRPGRIGSKAFKVCGKASGKARGKASGKANQGPPSRHLLPCVDYGDPGDDPIDVSSYEDPTLAPTASPSNQPSMGTNRAADASGSNKGTAVDIDYEPYEVSGSNDVRDQDEEPNDRNGGGSGSNDDVVGIGDAINLGGDRDGDAAVDWGHEEVPSNDSVPSNDERKN